MPSSRWVSAVAVALALSVCPMPASGQTVRSTRDERKVEGWLALEEGRYGDALEAFTAMIAQSPKDPSFRYGAGVAALMLGRTAEAREWLEEAVSLEPSFIDASLMLGEALYRDGQVAQAVAAYEKALKYAPDDPQLKQKLAHWKKDSEVQSRFYQAQGAHFTVHFEGPADDAAARRVVELLEQAYWRVGATLATYPAKSITVVLYTTQQFRDITRSPAWSGGVYDGRIKIPTRGASDSTEDLARVLEHELVHAMVATVVGPTVPVWINEGLATALEPGGLEWSEQQLARDSTRVSSRDLQRSFGALAAREARAAYAQSAVAVKKMLDLRGASATVALLQALGRGVPFDTAFQQTMFMRYEDFERLVSRD